MKHGFRTLVTLCAAALLLVPVGLAAESEESGTREQSNSLTRTLTERLDARGTADSDSGVDGTVDGGVEQAVQSLGLPKRGLQPTLDGDHGVSGEDTLSWRGFWDDDDDGSDDEIDDDDENGDQTPTDPFPG